MKQSLFLIFSILVLFSSCADRYKISGISYESFYDGSRVYLKQQTQEGWTTIDSCNIVHGKFGMNGNIDKEVMSILVMEDLEAPIIPVVLENGEITVKVGRGSIEVSGGRFNDELTGFMLRVDSFVNAIRLYERKENAMILDGHIAGYAADAVRDSIMSISKKMDGYIVNFIKQHYCTVLGPFAFRWLCPRKPRMTQHIESVLADAPQSFLDDSFIKEFMAATNGDK
ncbi:MAG: DUF4369 domain-containing protein [Bacteroidaceae bacterium]|nr:DUF4369 domain-containing protein [Bacteroidaceae bacterium]